MSVSTSPIAVFAVPTAALASSSACSNGAVSTAGCASGCAGSLGFSPVAPVSVSNVGSSLGLGVESV
ncbi:hypothetical protein ACFFHK_07005 [Gallibacterium trehalosifermentans]|uniref:Secreted protein n=1 Tax=Gallibacterium trehalosifermentans TaxID=516935 RepID=A0ABV6H1H7_9PAST